MATSTDLKSDCIENCQTCVTTVSDMLTSTCLSKGGDHVEQEHVKLMLDCIAACEACIGFMSRNSEFHSHYCGACAEICKACADNCEKIDGMEKCVECCRQCQETCSAMAS
ncbi:four-helix bundle copper-binding protein [Roseiconus lacunae]|uniref:Four-helix bundle copper-binding protein n=1 Tax=Roseiconus lacunae TaxID=2605694 RepID=A0ABT7PIU3_9BACT|nr:four-helix bundle copper-binding protein [Roseiconus lacunae]MDM4016219.1 four-helix bundle copper-binding protein [Roseiconus lacunae]